MPADLFQLIEEARARPGQLEVEYRGQTSGIDLNMIWTGILGHPGGGDGPVFLTCQQADGTAVRRFVLGDSALAGAHILGTGACPFVSAVESMHLNFMAADLQAVETASASLEQVSQSNADFLARAFDDTTEQFVNGNFLLPSDLDTAGTVTFYVIGFSKTAAASKNIEFRFGHKALADSEAQDVAYTNVDSGDLAVDSTQDDLDLLSWTETVSNLGWAASEYVQFRLSRIEPSANDLTGDWYLKNFTIDVPRT